MKKLHRFLIKEIPRGEQVHINDTAIVHLMNHVLKLAVGEQCIVFADGSNDYVGTIDEIHKHAVTLAINGTTPKKQIPKKIIACVSITKRDSFELVVQKLTELGVHTIIPIISDRTVKQSLRLDRLQKISDEALEQSGGSTRVHITEPQPLEETLEQLKAIPLYCFDMDGGKYTHTLDTEIAFYVGPEGGWSDSEKALFKQHNTLTISLGGTILRAETATIVALHTLLWY